MVKQGYVIWNVMSWYGDAPRDESLELIRLAVAGMKNEELRIFFGEMREQYQMRLEKRIPGSMTRLKRDLSPYLPEHHLMSDEVDYRVSRRGFQRRTDVP